SWVLLGQADPVGCPAADCPPPTRIRSVESTYDTEAYELTFATPTTPEGLRLRAEVDWAAGGGRYRVSVTALAFDDPATGAEVSVDDPPPRPGPPRSGWTTSALAASSRDRWPPGSRPCAAASRPARSAPCAASGSPSATRPSWPGCTRSAARTSPARPPWPGSCWPPGSCPAGTCGRPSSGVAATPRGTSATATSRSSPPPATACW